MKKPSKRDARAVACAEYLKSYLGITFHPREARLVMGDVELLVDVTIKAGRGKVTFPKMTLREPVASSKQSSVQA